MLPMVHLDKIVVCFLYRNQQRLMFHQENGKRPARHVYDFVGWPHNFAQFGKVCEVL